MGRSGPKVIVKLKRPGEGPGSRFIIKAWARILDAQGPTQCLPEAGLQHLLSHTNASVVFQSIVIGCFKDSIVCIWYGMEQLILFTKDTLRFG